jgi:hypothetical protein
MGKLKGYRRLINIFMKTDDTYFYEVASNTSRNSPVSTISLTTSNPPMNSPFTISCGKVGQSLSDLSSRRRRRSK